MNKIREKIKMTRGSVLAFTLIVLSIILLGVLSMTAVTITERRTSGATADSNQAFYVADSGMEIALKKIKEAESDETIDGVFGDCDGGTVSGKIDVDKNYKITFEKVDSNKKKIAITNCDEEISEIVSAKSVGSYSQANRAVETAIAAKSDVLSGTLCGLASCTCATQGCKPVGCSESESVAKCDGNDVLKYNYGSMKYEGDCPSGYTVKVIFYNGDKGSVTCAKD